MNWWGKLVGGSLGFLVGGPIGALLGAALGHSFDSGLKNLENAELNLGGGNTERIQAAFFTATFSIMGRIAKADGQVSSDEIALAEQTMARMQLNEEQRATARSLFTDGKNAEFDYQSVAQQLRKECGRRTNLLQMFMEIQLSTALADQDLHPEEQRILLDVASILGFHRRQFEQLLASAAAQQHFKAHSSGHEPASSANSLQLAYQTLGVSSSASDQEVKKAYRKLMSQHHPDKLVSKGLPEEMMEIATEKTRQIKEAYELIKRYRSSENSGS